jgi:hypothetical protein
VGTAYHSSGPSDISHSSSSFSIPAAGLRVNGSLVTRRGEGEVDDDQDLLPGTTVLVLDSSELLDVCRRKKLDDIIN